MSSYKCVLLVLFLSTSISAQLKIKPYLFENDKKEKVDAEFGTLLVPENRSNPDPLFLSSPKIKAGMMEFLRGEAVKETKIQGAPIKFVLYHGLDGSC